MEKELLGKYTMPGIGLGRWATPVMPAERFMAIANLVASVTIQRVLTDPDDDQMLAWGKCYPDPDFAIGLNTTTDTRRARLCCSSTATSRPIRSQSRNASIYGKRPRTPIP